MHQQTTNNHQKPLSFNVGSSHCFTFMFVSNIVVMHFPIRGTGLHILMSHLHGSHFDGHVEAHC